MPTPTSSEPSNDDVAVLMGNGVSIAATPLLRIPSINYEVNLRINRSDPSSLPAQIMQDVASKMTGKHAGDNFEAVYGVLDQHREALKMLEKVASVTGRHDLGKARTLADAADIVDELHRFGVSHVLEVIAARSRACYDDRGPVERFIEAILAVTASGTITIGNLNYDSLVMAVLSDRYAPRFCDMTDGRFANAFEVIPGTGNLLGRPIRTTQDFPSRKVTLLHLHGSLAWLRAPTALGGHVYRFDIGTLRDLGFWQAWREGDTNWGPEVVLTNQVTKATAVGQYPFAFGYEAFEKRLLTADRWIIAGYSLGDACVNQALATAFRKRKVAPRIMFIGHGPSPSQEAILDALDWDPWVSPDPSAFLYVHRGGLESVTASAPWKIWAANGRLAVAI